MIVEIFATTDVGQRRDHNEDNFAVCKDLSQKKWVFKPNEKLKLSEEGAVLVVADGMGGANAGEVASDIAQKVVQQQFNHLDKIPDGDKKKVAWLKEVIQEAHEEIVNHQSENLETAGMGTTIVVLWITPQKAFVAWCGDSRLYVFRSNTAFVPLTDDHSYVWGLVKNGQLSPEQARLHPESNIITQSLGDPSNAPKPEVRTIDYKQGDRFLLCSDGLNSMVSDQQIEAVLAEEESTMEACKQLISEANEAGGRDNITVLLLDIREEEVQPVVEAPQAARSNTQELRNYLKRKNQLIGLMGALLVGVTGYVIFGKSDTLEASGIVKLDARQIIVSRTVETPIDLVGVYPKQVNKVDSIGPVSGVRQGSIEQIGN